MKKLLWITLAALLAGGVATTATAQDEEVTQHEFSDADLVEGGLNNPWEEWIRGGRMRIPRRSLIRPRTSFAPELRKSLENL